jgi:hypothetical protein
MPRACLENPPAIGTETTRLTDSVETAPLEAAERVGGSATLRWVAGTRPSASGEAVIESNFEVLVGLEFFTASYGRGSVTVATSVVIQTDLTS